MSGPIRVMLVDDHEVVRTGLKAVLGAADDIEVVAEACSVAEAVSRAAKTSPDVILMDVRMPDGSGVEACRAIRAESPATRVVMLTSYSDEKAVLASVMAGASGYLLKEIRAEAILDAVRTVHAGHALLDPSATDAVLRRIRRGNAADEQLATLNSREREILLLIAEGKTNKEIGETIHLSDKTVKNYVSTLLGKLQLSRRSAAAALVTRLGLAEREDP